MYSLLKDKNNEIKLSSGPTGSDENRDDFSTEEERKKNLENNSLEQNIDQRKKFYSWEFGFAIFWRFFIVCLTINQIYCPYKLNGYEFYAILTVTTINMLGSWNLVGKYLFK